MNHASSMPTGPALQCLMGARASSTLAQDLGRLVTLPDEPREQFWDLLQGCLGPQLDDRVVTRLKRFAKEHDLEPEEVLPAAKACRFLLRHAARNDVSREAFTSDVKQLSTPENREALTALLLGYFDRAFQPLRQEVVFRSIAEHGNLVADVHWRLETLRESDHGVGLDVPLTSLTFSFRDGSDTKRVTMQLLPEQLKQLQGICDRILGG